MISREELVQTFSALPEEQLVVRYESGALTEMAREVAEAEMKRRGITPPRVRHDEPEAESHAPLEDLISIASFITPTEAYVLQSCLEAEGLRAVVADAQTIQMNQLLAPALGGVRVLVQESAVPRALEIKAAIARGEYQLDENFDVGTREL